VRDFCSGGYTQPTPTPNTTGPTLAGTSATRPLLIPRPSQPPAAAPTCPARVWLHRPGALHDRVKAAKWLDGFVISGMQDRASVYIGYSTWHQADIAARHIHGLLAGTLACERR